MWYSSIQLPLSLLVLVAAVFSTHCTLGVCLPGINLWGWGLKSVQMKLRVHMNHAVCSSPRRAVFVFLNAFYDSDVKHVVSNPLFRVISVDLAVPKITSAAGFRDWLLILIAIISWLRCNIRVTCSKKRGKDFKLAEGRNHLSLLLLHFHDPVPSS